MYFIIKYNVFNKYITNVTTTKINTCKKIFEFGQREVISFFTLVTKQGRALYYLFKHWLEESLKKESNTVKGAR